MNESTAPQPAPQPPTPDEMRFQMRRVEQDVFSAFNAMWFAVNKQIVRQVSIGLGQKPPEKDGDQPTPIPLVELVVLETGPEGEPLSEQFTADNQIDALKKAGAWAHAELVKYHQATGGQAADYFASVKALIAMRKQAKLRLVGRN